jgi:hypothetical protein
MWKIIKLVPIADCENPPDWSVYGTHIYGKYLEALHRDKTYIETLFKTLEQRPKDKVIYYIAEE